jgi:hypothetical protein
MVIFSAILMLMCVAAGALLLLLTHGATGDPTDPQLYLSIAVVGFGAPAIWSILNLILLSTRRQTGGQYVAGVRLAREDGAPLTRRDTAVWWFFLNPLLFSWPMGAVASLPLVAVVALAVSRGTLAVWFIVVALCVAAPLVALVSAVVDAHNRTLHDRIVGTIVVPAV